MTGDEFQSVVYLICYWINNVIRKISFALGTQLMFDIIVNILLFTSLLVVFARRKTDIRRNKITLFAGNKRLSFLVIRSCCVMILLNRDDDNDKQIMIIGVCKKTYFRIERQLLAINATSKAYPRVREFASTNTVCAAWSAIQNLPWVV